MSRSSLILFVLFPWIASFAVGYVLLLPQRLVYPVLGANSNDWNSDTFWFEPWGESGVHKGIDIFQKRGTAVVAASSGIVAYRGQLELGGNVVIVLGPKWRTHYYAHLDSISVRIGDVVDLGDRIGTVGTSGNAVGKAPHLHYAIQSLIPKPSGYRSGTQGWKRMFYLNPDTELRKSQMTNG